ncbi:hypothetical protein M2406_002066 [Serratia sp. BIGb0163]|nr:hypothetical protein [Serratia sp. BIGb0163]
MMLLKAFSFGGFQRGVCSLVAVSVGSVAWFRTVVAGGAET